MRVAVGHLSRGSRRASVLRGAAAAYRWALELRVWSIAGGVAVKVFAALLLVAPPLVKTPANLPEWCCGC